MSDPASDGVPPRQGQPTALSARDLELLRHLAAGRSTTQAAAAMTVSTNTVRTRLRRLQVKLAATGRDGVVSRTRQLGML